MREVREKWVHIRVTEDERANWHAQASAIGVTLADLIRRRMTEAKQVGREPVRRRAARRADPALLAALGRIGSNLNQVARWANSYKAAAEAVQVLAALANIDQILSSYRPGVSGTSPLTEKDAGDVS